MKFLIKTFKIVLTGYVVICLLLFFFQEKLIFFPDKLSKDYKFNFGQKFEEINIITSREKILNGILFKADSSKGLVFYLHGNAGSVQSWGEVSKLYTALNYDVFMLDYPGYGKSEGSINSQEQLFNDVQMAYNEVKKKYTEDKIVVLGYSIGTGPGAKVSSTNHPGLLILQAPYYSLTDMMQHVYPGIPTFLLKYKFETNQYLEQCKMPVVIFHGDDDEVIYYGSSLKLKQSFKNTDTLITLKRQGHNGMTDNPDYQKEIRKLFSK